MLAPQQVSEYCRFSILDTTASIIKNGDSYELIYGKYRDAVAFARFDEAILKTGNLFCFSTM